MSKIKLIHGDCLFEMEKISDNSIDLCLTDPPYGTTACKWDITIPFTLMWNNLKRIIKENGAICLFGTEPFSSHLRLSNLKMFKYDWIWKKNNKTGFANAKKMPLRSIEFICVFYKTLPLYKPQGLIKLEKPVKKSPKVGKIMGNHGMKKGYFQTHTNYPDETLIFNIDKKRPHPTQKPVALLEYLIKTYTLENETVLDFTMGSGSTGVACMNLNRNFIGIEKDDKYFKIAEKRIYGDLFS